MLQKCRVYCFSNTPHLPIFSILQFDRPLLAHPHVRCVLDQLLLLVGIMEISFLLPPQKSMQEIQIAHNTLTHRSRCSHTRPIQAAVSGSQNICSPDTLSDAPEDQLRPSPLDTKIPLDLTAQERLTSYSSMIHL